MCSVIAPLSASYLSTYIVNSYGKNLPAQIDSTEKGIAAFFFDNKTTTGVFFGIVFFDRQHGQLIEIVGMSLAGVLSDPTKYLNCIVQHFLY